MDATEQVHVLLVEDDGAAAALIEGNPVGYRISGLMRAGRRHRLRHGASGNYDILIVDRMLPKRDGLTMVQQLRGGPKRAGAFSVCAGRGRRPRCRFAGGDDYLVKPYAITELTARLEAWRDVKLARTKPL